MSDKKVEPSHYLCPNCGDVLKTPSLTGDVCGGEPVEMIPLYTLAQIEAVVEEEGNRVIWHEHDTWAKAWHAALDAILARFKEGR